MLSAECSFNQQSMKTQTIIINTPVTARFIVHKLS